MAYVKVWDPLILVLYGAFITLLLISSLLFFKNGKQKEDFNEEILLYGFAIYFLGVAIAFIFSILATSQLPSYYINHTLYVDVNAVNQNYYFFFGISLLIILIAITLWTLIFEIWLKSTKYLFTAINVILVSVWLIDFPLNSVAFYNVFLAFNIPAVTIMILIITNRSSPEFRPVSLILMIGFILLLLGIRFRQIREIPLIISPLILIFACFFFVYPSMINIKLFYRKINYFIGIGVTSTYVIMIIQLFYIMYYGIGFGLIVLLLLRILVTTIIYYCFIKVMRTKKILGESPNILGLFSKPQNITEEEISVAKEKKICLVCKNELLRENYICPDCKTFYCTNCSKSLSDLENACWVCNTPFDTFKPSKPFQKEEKEEIDVEKKMKGKGV